MVSSPNETDRVAGDIAHDAATLDGSPRQYSLRERTIQVYGKLLCESVGRKFPPGTSAEDRDRITHHLIKKAFAEAGLVWPPGAQR